MIFSQSVQISVDKNRLEEGDLLTLSIEVKGSEDFAKVDLNPLNNDFDILSGPSQQTNIQWINGSMTSAKTLTWTLSPKRGGNLVIPALNGTVGSKKFQGKIIPIQVAGNSNTVDESIFIIAELDNDEVYLGEQITLTYKLFKQNNLNIAGIDQFQMPDFKGFWVEELHTPQRLQYQTQQITLNGLKYQVANLGQRALFPIPSDNHKIPSVTVKTQLEIKRKKKRRDPFFDPFFDNFFSETQTKILRSKEKNIVIKTFPEPRPFDFNGAVGEFNISANTDRDEAKVNDGLTLSILLKGSGNLGLFSLPEIKFPEGIEAFPPTENFKKDVFRNELTGSHVWEYILIPRQAGKITIPRMQMSYFNPQSSSWVRIKTEPLVLNILPDNKEKSFNSGLTKREIKLIGQDIRFIKTTLKKKWNPENYRIKISLVIYFSSVFIFMLPIFLSKFSRYRILTKEDRKMRGAYKTSIRLLNKTNNKPFDISIIALYSFLEKKLLLKTHNLDPLSVEKLLEGRVNPQLINDVMNIIQICDAGKYSPESNLKDKKIIDEMKKILSSLEKELK